MIILNSLIFLILFHVIAGTDTRTNLTRFAPLYNQVECELGKVLSDCVLQRYCMAGIEVKFNDHNMIDYMSYPPVVLARKYFPQFGDMLISTFKEFWLGLPNSVVNIDVVPVKRVSLRRLMDAYYFGLKGQDVGNCYDVYPCVPNKNKRPMCYEIKTTCPIIKIHCKIFGRNKAWRKFFRGPWSKWKQVYKNCGKVMAGCKRWSKICYK